MIFNICLWIAKKYDVSNKLDGKRRRKYIANKTLDPLKKSNKTNINGTNINKTNINGTNINRENKFSLFNLIYVFVCFN